MGELTPIPKKILLKNIVHGIPAKELTEKMGRSVRNITKHRQKALETVRILVIAHKLCRSRIATPTER